MDEIGRNSVSPWTIPNSPAAAQFTVFVNAAYDARRLPAFFAEAVGATGAAGADFIPPPTRPCQMTTIAAAMNTLEYVPVMMPMIIVKAKPLSTSPPNR